jgi:hypothetical protein
MESVMETVEKTITNVEAKKHLKKDIKEKYGTIQKFCEIAEFSYSKMNMLFANRMKKESEDKMISQVEVLVNQMVKQMDNQIMTEDERKSIRGLIFSKHKNVRTFCMNHEEFSITFVSKIINGQRRKKDKKYECFLSVISQ